MTDIQTSLNEWVTLIESTTVNFRKHFSNLTILYESSDPASSIITNESLLEFKEVKSDVIKHISGMALLSELKIPERIKLAFKLMNLIEKFQSSIKQMREALDNASIKELTSSDTSHLNQTTNMLHMIFNNYITNFHKIQKTCFEILLHEIITQESVSEINSEMLIELDAKYPCVSFYSALLHYIFEHFRNSNLLENVELLKDRILCSTVTKSTFPFTFQMFDLVGSKYQTLDEIFRIKLKPDMKFEKIAKQISVDNKVFDIIVITNPTSYIYNLWTLTENIEYDCIDTDTIKQFETIKPVISKVKLSIKIYQSEASKSKDKSIERYYYVLETYDNEHYRVMTPWQTFPKLSLPYIPQSWLPNIGSKNYPSGRVEAYNSIIERNILKCKEVEKEFTIKSVEVNKEKGMIVNVLKIWFDDKIKKNLPKNLGEYRDLLNGDEFHDHIEATVVGALESVRKDTNIATLHSVASILTRRMAREILGIITKSTTLKNMFEMYPDKIQTELPPIFGANIEQCIDIVISYNTLLSLIDKKTSLDL
jgi:hypothetical protein